MFKNSLTTLPMGGGKGGSDFDPRGRSDMEVMRFCQAFMSELHRHIGKNVDVPAGDIGVGSREIGYLFGQYRRLRNEWTGAMTGKGVPFGGSLIRPEATGYGCVYFAQDMLQQHDEDVEGKRCVISGAGNVSQYTAKKLIDLGGKVLTLSDRSGFIHVPDGMDERAARRGDRAQERTAAEPGGARRGAAPGVPRRGSARGASPCDMAFPCATQNELDEDDARELLTNGCDLVSEGANMPATRAAAHAFEDAGILYGPGQGGERRRRGDLRPGDEPERHAPELVPGGGRPAPPGDHAEDPRPVRRATAG